MANGHGGHRPGSGRPKGSGTGAQLKSRLSPEQQRRADAAVRAANAGQATFPGDAYSLLAFIYKSEDLPLSFRLRAAETAIAYERPKLAQVTAVTGDVNPLQEVFEFLDGLQGQSRNLAVDRRRECAVEIEAPDRQLEARSSTSVSR